MFAAFCIAAPNSGSGKTTLSAGLMRLLSRTHKVRPFKCGPDYIDTSHHKAACGNDSLNLDTWLMGEKEVKNVFREYTAKSDIAVIEGVMGLFDGKKLEECDLQAPSAFDKTLPDNSLPPLDGSTAHIALLLEIPVILVIDCKGTAQSVSAVVRGFWQQCQDYGIKLGGIIANNTGSEKHRAILRESLEAWKLPPLLGCIPKNLPVSLKERQLGLKHVFEADSDSEKNLDTLADILSEHINIQKLLDITACEAPKQTQPTVSFRHPLRRKLAVAYDKAFCFYYPQSLRCLGRQYELVFFSPMKDKNLPKVHALYLGGGYPEIYAQELSANETMRLQIKDFAENSGHIFAECGGYVYLTSSLTVSDNSQTNGRTAEQAETAVYPFCGVINAKANMGAKLRSLGYRQGKLLSPPFFWNNGNPYFRAHEFHWSDIKLLQEYEPFAQVYENNSPKNIGIRHKNVCASYLHFYFANLL